MITVTEELRDRLISAVEAEPWDEGYKAELLENLHALPPNLQHDDTADWDGDPDAGFFDSYKEDTLCSLIDYFGLWPLVPELGW